MALSAETSISLILLGVSLIYFLFPPKKINYLYGYRTSRSMKNQERWKVANKMASRMMVALSVFDAVLSYVLVDLLNYNFLTIFIVLLLLEFGALFYLIEKKLGKNDA
ncbi:SdpI family protein [Aequorivita marina]|uniref:SdpI family protein n=1 Tax=Aequorivita marina TaxID=3073654 RepID=UPI0028740019|nr:SdpI family protein [Aequorivita sp. S2608]MDS1297430.1 SdpI family protein [Aequorivita sp. S2608]